MRHAGLWLLALLLAGCAGAQYRHFRENPLAEPFNVKVVLACEKVGTGWVTPVENVEAMCRQRPNGVAAWVFRNPSAADFEALWKNDRPASLQLVGCTESLGAVFAKGSAWPSVENEFLAVRGGQAAIVSTQMRPEYFSEAVGPLVGCDLTDAQAAELSKGVAGFAVRVPKEQYGGFLLQMQALQKAARPTTFAQALARHADFLKLLSVACPTPKAPKSWRDGFAALLGTIPAGNAWSCEANHVSPKHDAFGCRLGGMVCETSEGFRKTSEAIAVLSAHPAALGVTDSSTPDETVAAMKVLFKASATDNVKELVRRLMMPQLLGEVEKRLASIPPTRPWEYWALYRLVARAVNFSPPQWAIDAAAPLLPRIDLTWNRAAYTGMALVGAPFVGVPSTATRGPVLSLTLGPLQTATTTTMVNEWVHVPGEKAPPPPAEAPPTNEELQLYAELEQLESERQLQAARLGYSESADVGQRTIVKRDGRFEVQYQGGGASAATTWIRMDAEWKLMDLENRKRDVEWKLKRLRPPKTPQPAAAAPRGAHWEARPQALVHTNFTRTMSIALPSGKVATHVFSWGGGAGPYDHPEFTFKSELDGVVGRLYRQIAIDLCQRAVDQLATTNPDDAAWLANAAGLGPLPASAGWVFEVSKLTFGVPP